MRRFTLSATPSVRWGFVAAVALSIISAHAHAEDKADVQILKEAPAREKCAIGPELAFRSEREVSRPFEKLCRIEASVSALLSFVDLTGKAVEKARTLACTCGAEALVVAYNSSEHTARKYVSVEVGSTTITKGKRKFEEVVAFGIRFIAPPAPRPVPLKNGFRDLAWGDAMPADLVLSRDLPPVKFFTRPGDSLKLGPLEATRIEYAFIDGARLAEVALVFRRETEPALLVFLVQTWGAPDSIAKDGTHTWGRPEESTLAELTVTANETVLEIESRVLIEEAIRAMKVKAVKDAGL